jgi:hypothetical protein
VVGSCATISAMPPSASKVPWTKRPIGVAGERARARAQLLLVTARTDGLLDDAAGEREGGGKDEGHLFHGQTPCA